MSALAAVLTGCLSEPSAVPAPAPVESPPAVPAPAPPPASAPAPVPAPQPPTSSAIGEAEQRQVWGEVVEIERAKWINALEDSRDVESVDRLEFTDGALVLAVTSGWSSRDRRSEAAWAIVRDIRDLWTDASWPADVLRDPVWHKGLALTVDDLTYRCDGTTMRQVAERRMGRADWEAACQ